MRSNAYHYYAMTLILLSTLPLSVFALLCKAIISWGEKSDANYYAITYDCAHYTLFNSSRWCRTDSNDDPCPLPVELEIDCDSDTKVTTGNLTLAGLFSDAAIDISESCQNNTLSI